VLECHTSCVKCFTGGKYGCTKCPSEKFLWKGECLDSCPDFTYESDLGNDCLPCVSPCDLCSSETTCVSCRNGFYMLETRCVTKDKCLDGTYPDDQAHYCKKCAEACLTCYGPSNKECLSCNFEQGFSSDTRGICGTVICGEKFYRSINIATKEVTCLPCDAACSGCDSKGKDKCIKCQKGYISYPSSAKNRVECRECPIGFFKNSNFECEGTYINLL